MSFIAGSPLSATGGRVRQQGHLAGVLDRDGDVPLVLDAVAGHPTGADLAAVGDELAEQVGVLVVDTGRLLLAELANLLLRLADHCLRHCGAPFEPGSRRNGGCRWMCGSVSRRALRALLEHRVLQVRTEALRNHRARPRGPMPTERRRCRPAG